MARRKSLYNLRTLFLTGVAFRDSDGVAASSRPLRHQLCACHMAEEKFIDLKDSVCGTTLTTDFSTYHFIASLESIILGNPLNSNNVKWKTALK
eukprot:scaffold51200_cov20-Prasinocladus_malaysianus.AAC.1